ncbi:MAG TPA: hypothetical protein PLQ83_02340, partial [Thermoflexales bacterium]|nr:hypothetical protein [Thermoflexales bacterium]
MKGANRIYPQITPISADSFSLVAQRMSKSADTVTIQAHSSTRKPAEICVICGQNLPRPWRTTRAAT